MSEHLSEQQLKQYRERFMSPAELLRFDEHLADCEWCRQQVRTGAQLGASFATLLADLGLEGSAPGAHVTYEQLADLVDARLTGVARTVVEKHLSVCAACEAESLSLSAFRESLAIEASGDGQPARARGFAPAVWLRTLFSLPHLSAARAFAALALFGVATYAVLLGWNHRLAHPDESAARVMPTSRPEPGARTDSGTAGVSLGGAQPEATGTKRTEILPPMPVTRATSPAAIAHEGKAANTDFAVLKDGGRRVVLNSAGELVGLGWLAPSQAVAVRNALSRGHVTTPEALAGLKREQETLLGDGAGADGASFSPSHPVGVIVESPRPRFAWQPLAGATRYVIDIYDQTFSKVVTSGDLTQTAWSPPNDLKRDATYSWEITAYTSGGPVRTPAPPAPEARFKVLGQAWARELRRAKRVTPRSHLALGVLYARAGLLDQAEREFELLAAANPHSKAVQKLLRDVRAQQQ